MELARQNESLFYRIYAHIRDSIKLITGSEEEQFLIEARRKYAKAIRNLANERTVDLRKYSIEQDENGNDYVLVNTDQEQFYTTNNVKKLKSIANEYYKNNIQGNVYVLDDKNYTTNAKSKKKYVGDINTLKNDIKRLKLRMLPELPNIIKVAQTINSDDDTKGKHNFSKDGWEYKKAIVRYEGNDYEVLLNVGKNDNTRTVYDINNIKINIHRHSRWFFIFGHSPILTGSTHVCFLLACQPCIFYLLPVNGSGSNILN